MKSLGRKRPKTDRTAPKPPQIHVAMDDKVKRQNKVDSAIAAQNQLKMLRALMKQKRPDKGQTTRGLSGAKQLTTKAQLRFELEEMKEFVTGMMPALKFAFMYSVFAGIAHKVQSGDGVAGSGFTAIFGPAVYFWSVWCKNRLTSNDKLAWRMCIIQVHRAYA